MSLKHLIIISIFCLSISSYGTESPDGQKHCDYNLEDFLIMELVDQIEGQFRFNAQVEAKKIVLKQCQSMKNKGNKTIRIKGKKILISDYSNSWDSNDSAFFCKNSAGYESQINQIVQKIILFSREKEKKKREAEYRKNPPKKIKRPASKPKSKKKTKLWACSRPLSYIKTILYLDHARMEDHINAHGPESCKPYN